MSEFKHNSHPDDEPLSFGDAYKIVWNIGTKALDLPKDESVLKVHIGQEITALFTRLDGLQEAGGVSTITIDTLLADVTEDMQTLENLSAIFSEEPSGVTDKFHDDYIALVHVNMFAQAAKTTLLSEDKQA